jgi:hypothetical protein
MTVQQQQTTELPGIGDKLLFAITILLIYATVVALQWYEPEVTDVSWLFVIGEKIFAGQHLYVDIMETNPPMSVLLYMPTLILSHLTHVSAELLQIFLTLLLVTLSVGWSSRILYATGQIRHLARYRILAALAFGLLPFGCYSEREHFAVLLTLPALAVIAARCTGHRFNWPTLVLVGLGEGLSASIKPQMAFPILLAVGYAMVWTRSLKIAFRIEHWIAAAVVAVYIGVVFVYFPEYITNMLPILMDTYRPVRYSPVDMALGDGAIAFYLFLTVIFLSARRDGLQPRLMIPVMASIGYYASYMEQSKGWPYHLYPAVAISALLFFNEVLDRLYAADLGILKARLGFTARICSILAFVAGAYDLTDWLEGRQWDSFPLAEQMEKYTQHPTIAIISDDLGLTHPLTRMVQGEFVGTVASQWITAYARHRMMYQNLDAAGIERMKAWVDYDRGLLAKDIRRAHPDFIVVDRGGFDWLDWARQSPELARLLADYRQAGKASDIYLLARGDIAPDAPHPSTGRFWRLGASDRWRGLDPEETGNGRLQRSAAR